MSASPFEYPSIRPLIDLLQARIQAALGDQLVGLYVVGSLVTGDFDERISDIDLIAALATPLDNPTGERLKQMHADITRLYPQWDDRIEAVYITAEHLRQPRTLERLGVISPGEPFHIFAVSADDWLLNWYVLRQKGIALVGAAPSNWVAPIALDDLLPRLRQQLDGLAEWAGEPHHWGAQAYVILTMCRALYTFRRRDFVSKKQAGLWAAQELPQWSPLIRRVLAWREAGQLEQVDAAAAHPETLRFVRFVLAQIDAV